MPADAVGHDWTRPNTSGISMSLHDCYAGSNHGILEPSEKREERTNRKQKREEPRESARRKKEQTGRTKRKNEQEGERGKKREVVPVQLMRESSPRLHAGLR